MGSVLGSSSSSLQRSYELFPVSSQPGGGCCRPDLNGITLPLLLDVECQAGRNYILVTFVNVRIVGHFCVQFCDEELPVLALLAYALLLCRERGLMQM